MARRTALLGMLVALGLPLSASASDADPWFGRDKALHFSLSAALAGGGYATGALLFPEHRAVPFATGAGLALTLGVGKELVDHLEGRHFSLRDLTWDVAGTLVGLALSWAIDSLIIRPLLHPQQARLPLTWSLP